MRTLLARQVSTGQWCCRLDTGQKDEEVFRAELVAEYGIAGVDLAIVTEEWDQTTYDTNKAALNAGTFRTAAVILPPAPPVVPNPYGFRQALVAALDGADRAAKLARAKALRQKWPGFTEPFLRALQGPELNAEEAWWIKALWADVRARVGSLTDEIITAGERDRIEALAPPYGITLV